MPRQYPTGFRDEMVRRMLTGEPVLTICSDTGVPEQTLHRWKHQALIDAGLVDGIDSTQSAALRAAHKRIKFLEKELQLVKDASEIYDPSAVADPRWFQAVVATSSLLGGCCVYSSDTKRARSSPQVFGASIVHGNDR